ncbi:MAG TPA: RNA helicase, partial [Actinomycetota bacterium]|nr:RNA helicase [Actinomycetota bacterium]
LVWIYDPEQVHQLLNSSFAQFRADRGVVTLERQLDRDRKALEGYREHLRCDVGDFDEYWALRREADDIRRDATRSRDRERLSAARDALASLRPGDVIYLPRARRRGLAVVLTSREGRPTVLTRDRKFFRIAPKDFDEPPTALTRIPLPRGSVRSARYRRDLAARLASLKTEPPRQRTPRLSADALARAADLEARADAHPVARCPDLAEHERWAERATRLERRIANLDRRIRTRTETLARQFDRVLSVLERLDYVRGFSLTERGERLARIYGEGDILMAEAIAEGKLRGVSAAGFAALASTLVYESRERTPRAAEMPTGALKERYRELQRLWARIRKVEEANGVELCRELDAGFAATVFHWAEGKTLEDALAESAMAPGDFVRTCKQLLDLLRQIEQVAEDETRELARSAHEAVNRGVVAYTGV